MTEDAASMDGQLLGGRAHWIGMKGEAGAWRKDDWRKALSPPRTSGDGAGSIVVDGNGDGERLGAEGRLDDVAAMVVGGGLAPRA